ncbi:hypothetical protein [uncultured Sphingomonas sp.]|uniref:hypothetical protein n=1 Tax=uncultured Sphingomonas sp. TaxID=158754 RepID=UPI0035CAE9C5
MSVADHLAALTAGRRPADDGLLGNCRLEWRGGEAYGEEAILELFRSAPFDAGPDAVLVETAASAALVGADGALVADVYDGRIGRLWRIGPGGAPETEPAVSVAFDPDLRQVRGGVLIGPGDHPELDAGKVAGVVAAAEALVAAGGPQPLHRARAFAMRAFTGTAGTAALLAVHRLTGGPMRGGGFAYAAIVIDGPSVADPAPEGPWAPRL